MDAKTTCYKYEGKKEENRSSSERKLLLEKVSAILDNVNDEYTSTDKDNKTDAKEKEIILNKDQRTVTVIGKSTMPRKSRSRSPSPRRKFRRSRSRSRPRSRTRSLSPYRGRYQPRRSWSRSPRRLELQTRVRGDFIITEKASRHKDT